MNSFFYSSKQPTNTQTNNMNYYPWSKNEYNQLTIYNPSIKACVNVSKQEFIYYIADLSRIKRVQNLLKSNEELGLCAQWDKTDNIKIMSGHCNCMKYVVEHYNQI